MKTAFLKAFILLTCIILLFQISFQHGTKSLNSNEDITIKVDGEKINLQASPVIVDGRTLVPARSVFENLGAKVSWNDKFKIITIVLDQKKIELAINLKRAKINKQDVYLDVAPKIINDRTMIPLRFVSEALSMDVNWHEKQRLITIDTISTIKDITLHKENDTSTAIFNIASNNNPKYEKMILLPNNISPHRLVIDFLDSKIVDLPNLINVYEYPITTIRISQLDKLTAKQTNRPQNTVRVVFDLVEETSFEIKKLDKMLSVSLSLLDAPKNFASIEQSRGGLKREQISEKNSYDNNTTDKNQELSKDNENIKQEENADGKTLEDSDIFKGKYDIFHTDPTVIKFGDVEYHNFMDRVAIIVNNSQLTDGRRDLKELYTSYYSDNSKQFIIEFDKKNSNLSPKEIKIYDEFINTIQIINENNETKIIVNATNKYIYNVFSRSNLDDTAITLLNPNLIKENLVVIDPGHGGSDSGAIVPAFTEKELNLDIALRLKKILDEREIPNYLLRADDSFLDLYERSYIANKLNASLFLSIHNNAHIASTKGTETLYYGLPPTDRFVGSDFAKIVQNELFKTLGTVNRGIINRPNLVVLRETSMPAALAEIAFMTNQHDRELLKNPAFRQASAVAMANAIQISLGEIKK